MCGCRFRSGNRQYLSTQGYSTIISSPSLVSGNTYSDFMFYRCISEPKFLSALSTIKDTDGVTLDKKIKTQEDVRKLADMVDKGGDKKYWNKSIKSLLGSINFTQSEINKAECSMAFAND